MIEEAGIEAIVVAIPDDLHHPVTMAALEAGLHVLCEKPLALTLAQAREMYERAEEVGVRHMTYFTWRWYPVFQHLRRLIEEGYLGRYFYSHYRFIAGYGRAGKYGWKWDRQRGLGILGDLGVHMIDMARWCVGEVHKVSAHLPVYIERPGAAGGLLDPTNDLALLSLKFEDGSQGMIQVSALTHTGDRGMELQVALHGEAGRLEVDLNFKDGYVIRGARSGEDQIRPLRIPDDILNGIDQYNPLSEQHSRLFMDQSVGTRLFIDSILEDVAVTPSFYDGLKAQAVIEAAIEADECERWVTV
jgi:predicted dehydrogenase